MAVKMTGFDELEKFLNALAEPSKMAIKAVDKAAPVLAREVKKRIPRSGKNREHLADHIETTKAKENQMGVFAVVKPENGADSSGTRYVERMAYLEYGVAAHGQRPHPVRAPAIEAARKECERIMQETIYEEVDKL